MTTWTAPTAPGDKHIEVYDRDVTALLDEREKANRWVAAANEAGSGDLGQAITVQSQIEAELDECRVLDLSISDAYDLVASLRAALSEATRQPTPSRPGPAWSPGAIQPDRREK